MESDRELQAACDAAGLEMEFLEVLQDAKRYRYLREHYASVGLHGIELMWDQPDHRDALDNRLDAFIERKAGA